MDGAKLVRRVGTKDEAESEDMTKKRLEMHADQIHTLQVQTEHKQTERSRENAADGQANKPMRVLTWDRAKLSEGRIEQPWHERLRLIRGDQDLNF